MLTARNLSVTPARLTFAAADWDTPQLVTVTGVDDDEIDGDVGYSIVTSAATSGDAACNGLLAKAVEAINLDDDAPPPSCHVGDLDGAGVEVGDLWQAKATVLVHDAEHEPVANATVRGSWGGQTTNPSTCTTNASDSPLALLSHPRSCPILGHFPLSTGGPWV